MNIDKRYTFSVYGNVKRKTYYSYWWIIAPRNRIRVNTDEYDIKGIDNGYYLEMRCPDRVKRWIREFEWINSKDNLIKVYDLVDCPTNAFHVKRHKEITQEEFNAAANT